MAQIGDSGKPGEGITRTLLEGASAALKKVSSVVSGSPGKSAASSVDRVSTGMGEVFKSLTVLADEVIKKLEEIIGDQVPGGIRALAPEEHTPEKTAERIVQGSVALFSAFRSQNADLEGEELLEKFMSTIRGGVERGHSDAMATLGDIGALEFEGVKSGISKTMELVDQKLQAFESNFLASLSGANKPAEERETTAP